MRYFALVLLIAAPTVSGEEQHRDASLLAELKKDFPDVDVNVLQTVVKFLEDNFGVSTAEDLQGVSDWAVNGLSLDKNDQNVGAEAKITLQLLFQKHGSKMRRLASSSPMPTTGSETTGGAVTAKQLATSVAAVLLVKLLAGL